MAMACSTCTTCIRLAHYTSPYTFTYTFTFTFTYTYIMNDLTHPHLHVDPCASHNCNDVMAGPPHRTVFYTKHAGTSMAAIKGMISGDSLHIAATIPHPEDIVKAKTQLEALSQQTHTPPAPYNIHLHDYYNMETLLHADQHYNLTGVPSVTAALRFGTQPLPAFPTTMKASNILHTSALKDKDVATRFFKDAWTTAFPTVPISDVMCMPTMSHKTMTWTVRFTFANARDVPTFCLTHTLPTHSAFHLFPIHVPDSSKYKQVTGVPSLRLSDPAVPDALKREHNVRAVITYRLAHRTPYPLQAITTVLKAANHDIHDVQHPLFLLLEVVNCEKVPDTENTYDLTFCSGQAA
jgi:hypothetical protein